MTIEKLVEIVASVYGISETDCLAERRRDYPYCEARHMLWYAMRDAGYTVMEICRITGNPWKWAVYSALETSRRKICNDVMTRHQYRIINAKIESLKSRE